MTEISTHRNYIGGEWRASSATETLDNVNPADARQVLGRVPRSPRQEARDAIDAAVAARAAWRAIPAPARARKFLKIHQVMEGRIDELARALTREEGKIFPEAKGEVLKTLNLIEWFIGEGMRYIGRTAPSEMPNNLAYTVRQPIGTVGLITPWNFPVAIPVWKIAPALIAGNTVVFKPAEATPATAQICVEICEEAGIPAGVVNMVFGDGPEVGDEIIRHPEVGAISFTGSTATGTRIYEAGAAALKKVQCEMGGKNPVVVLEDADLDLAALGTAQGAFGSTGQRCTATSRAIVIDSVADAFVEKVIAHADAVKAGNGLDEGVTMGPSIDERQMNKVLDYIEIGKGEAKLARGGKRLTEGDLAHGFFVDPTVFDEVSRDTRIAREEIFGPVLSVLRVKDFDEAMAAANDVDYGLTSSIYTVDPNRMFRFIDEIETGITHVNSPTMGGEAQLPFGGIKATGVGEREMGPTAIEFFSELKTVYIDYTGSSRKSNIY